jgi:2-oxoglutarate dehydrogenase E1 component
MTAPQILPDSVNLAFVEALYADYLRNPAGVPPQWRTYFEELARTGRDAAGLQLGPSFHATSIFNPAAPRGTNGHKTAAVAPSAVSQDRIDQLVRAYRVRGHLVAQIDPLHHPHPERPELKPRYYGFTKADLDRTFSARTISGGGSRTLREILFLLRNTYCRSIGVQFMHIDSLEARHWLQDRMEGTQNRLKLARAAQLRILTKLTDAVIFEEFIQKKYVGAKRFSLEGAESLIPLLDCAIEHAGDQDISEVVIGMAHRGRLNVLANITGKSPRQIFRLFEDIDAELYTGRGDVKYHLGHHGDYVTSTGKRLHLALCFNPSHLEFVNPVALGRVRAKQDRLGDTDRAHSMCILIHGDAAFAGQGIVQETLNLSELAGYRTGGTLHVIVNNQLGFTTTPEEGRSTRYASDVAKMLQSPIFHVNGEDPEAVAQVIRLALDFRQTFRRDVVIDMYGYRRYGHNESDEPSFTQPVLYRRIEARPTVREGYLRHLLALGEVTREEADEIAEHRKQYLEQELAGVRDNSASPARPAGGLGEVWSHYVGGPDRDTPEVDTGVARDTLAALLAAQARVPDGFHVHPKLTRLLDARARMAAGKQALDWAAAESLAFATLATTGTRVRLSGQDSARGTFSHRHAILYDYEDNRPYCALQHLDPAQAPFEVLNSPLSEAGVLGFEYGYSIAYPDALLLWEAQFGDFVNTAQVFIDQFLASAEDKWHSLSGLVLLLPHGLEGQGPEHSSARLERFLMLAAEDNIQVAYPSTPAQYYHLLRRQVVRPWRKPLVIMTPKSLLRHPQAVSPLDDLATGRFQRVLADPLFAATSGARQEKGKSAAKGSGKAGAASAGAADTTPTGAAGASLVGTPTPGAAPSAAHVRRVLLCSGKLYYELLAERERRQTQDVAIVRIEQLYPLPDEALAAALAPYADGTPVFWVQEEPANMAAAPFLRLRFGARVLGRWPFAVVSRPPSASPATGSAASHKLEQARVIAEALGA